MGLGAYLIGTRGASDAVARIGRKNISYDKFLKNVYRYTDTLERQNIEVTDEMRKEIKKQVLQEMMVEEVLSQSALDYDIMVTDKEVFDYITSVPAFQKNGVFDSELYHRGLWYAFRMKPAEFEADTRHTILAGKFRFLLTTACKSTPAETLQTFLTEKSDKTFAEGKLKASARVKQFKLITLLNYYFSIFARDKGIGEFLEKREKGE